MSRTFCERTVYDCSRQEEIPPVYNHDSNLRLNTDKALNEGEEDFFLIRLCEVEVLAYNPRMIEEFKHKQLLIYIFDSYKPTLKY